MSRIKFTVFSDLHHYPLWYKSDAPERLAAIQKRALEKGSEFLIELGDLTHKPTAISDLIKQYKDFTLPGYFVLGNHEFDIDSYEDVLKAYGLERGYYSFDRSGFRFVVLDENYFRDFPGIYFHYSSRNYFDHPQSRDFINPEQLEWFRDTVLTSPYPCIVCSHAPLDYPSGAGVRCKTEPAQIIRDSQKTPGRVILCMNGHYHRSGLDIVGGVARLDVNSATFNWIPNPHDLFPEKEWYKEYECIGNMVIYEDPISSVITIDTDAGFIDIEGTESRFLHGVTTELSGNGSGIRACLPGALSGRVLI